MISQMGVVRRIRSLFGTPDIELRMMTELEIVHPEQLSIRLPELSSCTVLD